MEQCYRVDGGLWFYEALFIWEPSMVMKGDCGTVLQSGLWFYEALFICKSLYACAFLL